MKTDYTVILLALHVLVLIFGTHMETLIYSILEKISTSVVIQNYKGKKEQGKDIKCFENRVYSLKEITSSLYIKFF